ncbi:MAG: molybdopterin-guanine dinucleotide biosynthesis protein A [Phenylobacterium sp.]|jgi:molybdopterin-guanine dinucleotide biosynthesis protein A
MSDSQNDPDARYKLDSDPIYFGIILAGGQSTRMGADKAELIRGGITMLEHSKALLQQVGIDKIRISRNVGDGIRDIFTNNGPLGGIHAAVNDLPDGAVVIIPVDMPLLQSADLNQLIEVGAQSNRPVYFSDCYLPLYLPINQEVKDYLHQQLANDGNRRIKGLIEHFSGSEISPDSSTSLVNTNTPSEWQQFQQHLNQHP